MKEYSTADPEFSNKIMITESTDPAHADNINQAPMQLLQNTIVLNNLIENLNKKSLITKAVLAAGATSITIIDRRITTNSALLFYTSKYGVNPTDVSVAAGKVTLTFDAQSDAMEVGVRVDG